MNLWLYLILFFLLYLGMTHEIMFNRTNKSLLIAGCIMFVLTTCSRIGYQYSYSDLAYYLDCFVERNDSYFEPGYVLLCNILRFLFGTEPYVLVTACSIWVIGSVLLSDLICSRFDYDTNDNNEYWYYPSSLLFFIILYWGFGFACETLRTGLAISLLFLSAAFSINEKYIFAILILLLATLFHYTSVLLLFGVLTLVFARNIKQEYYFIWFVIIIAIDVIVGFITSFDLPYISNLFEIFNEVEGLERYSSYADTDIEPYLSTQYLTYHFFGFVMLFGDLNDKSFNRSVLMYFIGLTLGTLFQTTIIVARIQWIYLSLIVFVLYYYIRHAQREFIEKITIVSLYGIIQSIMILRWLGWHT